MTGIMSGMVMQRNKANVSEITLSFQENEIIPNFRCFDTEGNPVSCSLSKCNDKYVLQGIPVGGPYKILADDTVFDDVYVGDLWILAGQSNMEGMGQFYKEDLEYKPVPYLRHLHMDNHWAPAVPFLHKLWLAYDKVHTDVLGAAPEDYLWRMDQRGLGPGLFFAEHMYDFENVPQGLLPCAHGGTKMSQWNPDDRDLGGDKSLYGAMYRRFVDNGSHVRGIFWYQGCSDANYEDFSKFEENVLYLFKKMREDFGDGVPIVEVQINRVHPESKDNGEGRHTWTGIREIQRKMSSKVPNLATCYTVSYPMADPIHIHRDAQIRVAKNASMLMHNLIHGLPSGETNVDVENIVAENDSYRANLTNIKVPFTGIKKLQADPQGLGFSLFNRNGEDISETIYNVEFHENTALVKTSLFPGNCENMGLKIAYGYGCSPACNITDENGFSIPAFDKAEVRLNFD